MIVLSQLMTRLTLDEIISIDNNYEFDDLLKNNNTFKYLKLNNFGLVNALEGTLDDLVRCRE